jgi:Adenosine deaminase
LLFFFKEHFDAQNFPNLHDEHYQVFTNKAKSVKYKDIPVTMHAGESPDESSFENVRRAVEEYGASRIGHGYRVVKDAALMQQLRRDKIHLEVCPTSSDETGGWVYDTHPQNGGSSRSSKKKKQWSQHPIVEMLHAGLSFSFSSDDPAVFHTSLAWQYRVAMVKMGFTREEMLRCNLNAIDAAFCSPEEKSKLRRHVLDFAAYSGLEDVNATIASSDDAVGETGKWAKNSISPRGNKHLQQHTERGAWRYTSTSANSSIHRAHHTMAADSALLPSTTATPPQWKRSMSANFVDRVYVYKPSEGGTDNAKEYEYL